MSLHLPGAVSLQLPVELTAAAAVQIALPSGYALGDGLASALLAVAICLPALLTLLLAIPGPHRASAASVAAWSPALALVAALVSPAGTSVDASWLLLGTSFGIDPVGRLFLLLTSSIWLLAGVYALAYVDRHRFRYFAFHSASLAGNLALTVAHDAVGFYLAFLLMTLAAFGLIIHEGTPAARYAAKVYLALAVAGEGLLLYGLVTLVAATGSIPSLPEWRVGAGEAMLPLLLGFGIKAGFPVVHVWLPLAHPQAPTPASAVLSGAMIKAGLLGWLRFLLPGEVTASGVGTLCLVAGLLAAFLAAGYGFFQAQPKALLAYSSVSQMGFMTVGVGVGLLVPETRAAVVVAVSIFALHHALVKGALFLATGLAPSARGWLRPLLLAGVALAAAALAGVPFTAGGLAKELLKEVIHLAEENRPWLARIAPLVSLAAAGSALLMLRLLAMLATESTTARERPDIGRWLPWAAAVAAVAVVAPLTAHTLGLELHGYAGMTVPVAWGLLWPTLLACALFAGLRRVPWRFPPGDLLVVIERASSLVRGSLHTLSARRRDRGADGSERPSRREHREGGGRAPGGRAGQTGLKGRATGLGSRWLGRAEANLMRWDSAGALLLILAALLLLSLTGGDLVGR